MAAKAPHLVIMVFCKETAFPLWRAMDTGQALEQECCFPGVLCDGGDMSEDLLCQIYGHVMLRTRCLDSKRVKDMGAG